MAALVQRRDDQPDVSSVYFPNDASNASDAPNAPDPNSMVPLTDAAPSSLDKTVNAALGNYLGVVKQAQTNTDALVQEKANTSRDFVTQLHDENAGLHDQLTQMQSGFSNIKPFEAPVGQKNPISFFGSMAGALAMVASFATKQPLTASLNAFAAGMNAIKQNNMEGYNQAFSEWKANTDFAMKRLDWENGMYKNAMELMKTDYQAGVDQIKLVADQIGDEAAKVALAAGPVQIGSLLYSREIMGNRVNSSSLQLQAVNDQFQAYAESHNGQPPPAEIRAQIIQDVMRKGATSGGAPKTMAGTKAQLYNETITEKEKALGRPTTAAEKANIMHEIEKGGITGNQADKLNARVDQIGNSMETIDSVLGTLNKYVAAAGTLGRGRRLVESLSNLAGSSQTDLKQMGRDIERLQLVAPRLLLDSQGRPIAAEAGKINDIVAGLSFGDTTQNTIRALSEIKSLYAQMKAQAMARSTGTWHPDIEAGPSQPNTGVQLPQPSAPWLHDPVAGR